MPQQGGSAPIKTKKKGRQPAHMNKGFAFRHNPKSKKTDKILASVNQHCCRRCRDKIEWRKAYRKYKPRTQLGSCNLCRQKRVKAAYHTICTKCTTSDKAWRFCREAKVKMMGGNVSDLAEAKEGEEEEEEEEELNDEEGEIENKKLAATLLAMASKPALRVCAVCVKEKALPDTDGDEPDVSEIIARMGPMSLRESRGLERQLLRQQQEANGELPDEQEEEDAGKGDDNEEQDAEQVAGVNEQPVEVDDDDDSNEPLDEEEDYREEQDPFLQAVGGADKLLTGEAYQEMILAKAGEKATDA
jgi:hypothetical protein